MLQNTYLKITYTAKNIGIKMELQKIINLAVNALEDIKGVNITVLDTTQLSSLFRTIIVCSGTSNRQVKALANNVSKDLKANGIDIIGTEGEQGGEWVLVDCGDVVIHIMLPQVREYYDLESLWNGSRPSSQQ